jgi:exodeoxyribonuclease VII small subunit
MTGERRRRAAQNGTGNKGDARREEPLAFEETLGRLDEMVSALESGQLPLDDAIRLYEEGVRLAQRCQQMLDNAELRIQRLRAATESDDAGEAFVLETFELRDAE